MYFWINKKKNMTIHFKNGTKKTIPYEVAETLKNNIVQGSADIQIFNDNNEKLFLLIRLSEIVLID